ncbi:hypothetical protein PFISCL1PPCAC_12134, partial [Pristionchus fissidentatus]
ACKDRLMSALNALPPIPRKTTEPAPRNESSPFFRYWHRRLGGEIRCCRAIGRFKSDVGQSDAPVREGCLQEPQNDGNGNRRLDGATNAQCEDFPAPSNVSALFLLPLRTPLLM